MLDDTVDASTGGPHHCQGAHLARPESLITVEERHAAISHHHIATDEAPAGRGGQLARWSLPIVWDLTTEPTEGITA